MASLGVATPQPAAQESGQGRQAPSARVAGQRVDEFPRFAVTAWSTQVIAYCRSRTVPATTSRTLGGPDDELAQLLVFFADHLAQGE